MLAHIGDLAADPFAQVRHRELADGKQFEDAQALRVRQRAADGRIARSVEFLRNRQAIRHRDEHINACANTQVVAGSGLTASADS